LLNLIIDKCFDEQKGYCQFGITSSPPALMMLCIAAAEACHGEKDGIDLLERRVPVGPK
jgi:hypothetical protein